MIITGIVINSNQYRDYDEMVNVLSNDGIHSFLARGIRKQNAKNAYLTLDLTESEFDLLEYKDKLILKTGSVKLSSAYLLDSFEGTLFINFVKELSLKLFVEEDYQDFFPYLLDSLNCLKTNFSKTYVYFLMSYLYLESLNIIGYSPIEFIKNNQQYKEFNESIVQIQEKRYSDSNSQLYIKFLHFCDDLLSYYSNISLKVLTLI